MNLYDKYIYIMSRDSEILCKITEKLLTNMVNIKGYIQAMYTYNLL